MADHKSFISPLNILFNKLNNDFSCLYWIPELHKNPYRENNNAGAYSFQENILTAVKGGIQSYWVKAYSRGSFNQMWILNYWIFCIMLIIVLFQKCSMSKHVIFQHFTNHESWECIKTFKHIINNAVIFKMVGNVTNV